MQSISLIQTSRSRFDDLVRFVHTLNEQVNIPFESIQYIFIDQGDNKRAFNDLDKGINFVYSEIEPCSLSKARNFGLKLADGDVICFPDDDCWLEKDTLSKVLTEMENNYVGVTIKATNENKIPCAIFPLEDCVLTKYNHYGAFSPTIFLKRIDGLFFDENLGVGTPYKFSSGEETDFLIRYMERTGGQIVYKNDIIIHHPIAKSAEFNNISQKRYEYARGWGYVMRKHKYPLRIIAKSFIRPFLGVLVYMLSFRFNRMKISAMLLKGRVEGFLEYPRYK